MEKQAMSRQKASDISTLRNSKVLCLNGVSSFLPESPYVERALMFSYLTYLYWRFFWVSAVWWALESRKKRPPLVWSGRESDMLSGGFGG